MFASAAPPDAAPRVDGASPLLWASLIVGMAAALYVAARVASQSIVIGSVEGNFFYRYSRPFASSMLWAAVPVLATVVALAYAPRDVGRRHARWLLIVWFVAASAHQAQLRTLTPFSYEQMFASDTANSFYGAAKQHRAGALLRRFDALRRSLPLHARSNMPGKVLLASALGAIVSSAGAQAWLVVMLSNLGAVFLYLLVVDWLGDCDAALFAFVLYLYVPAKFYFFPLLNTVTPTFALAWVWLCVRRLRSRSAAYAASFGLATYGLVLFDPLPIVLGLLLAAIAIESIRAGRVETRGWLRYSAVALAAFGMVYLLMLATFRFDLFRTFQELGTEAAAFNVDEERRYGVWAFQNLLDFGFGAGLCQAALFVALLIDGVRRIASSRRLQPIATLSVGLAAVLLTVDLLGVNRGEVIRLWTFLACLWQVPAAVACARLHSRTALALVLCATVVQDALGTAMIGFVSP
ncbi:MAG TPA: hypothetical protein VFB07_02255 [Vicinamibacterales bacterium]|nr:hypothetical protein [Vicinamibacterales bacterium]